MTTFLLYLLVLELQRAKDLNRISALALTSCITLNTLMHPMSLHSIFCKMEPIILAFPMSKGMYDPYDKYHMR